MTVRESRQKEKKKGFCEAKTNINDLMLYCDASTTLISSTSVVFFSIWILYLGILSSFNYKKMLTNVFRVMVKDPIKENFYEKKKKKIMFAWICLYLCRLFNFVFYINKCKTNEIRWTNDSHRASILLFICLEASKYFIKLESLDRRNIYGERIVQIGPWHS